MAVKKPWILIFLLIIISPFLDAQANTSTVQELPRRIVWRGGNYTLRYAVEIDRFSNNAYRSYAREFTTENHFDISLPLGSYRYRIIPYDILDRPAQGTQWVYFEVRLPQIQQRNVQQGTAAATQLRTVGVDDNDPEPEEEPSRAAKFHTLGLSAGTAFISPLLIASVHGTISPVRYVYLELGCDFGFISKHEDITEFNFIYPFSHLGLFLPFKNKGGIFAGAGAGYLMSNYFVFDLEDGKDYSHKYDFIIGVNLGNFLNISYTLQTDFDKSLNKTAIGFVYRFGIRN